LRCSERPNVAEQTVQKKEPDADCSAMIAISLVWNRPIRIVIMLRLWWSESQNVVELSFTSRDSPHKTLWFAGRLGHTKYVSVCDRTSGFAMVSCPAFAYMANDVVIFPGGKNFVLVRRDTSRARPFAYEEKSSMMSLHVDMTERLVTNANS
jgi:hypothetical protein